jgi:hypothetical protein
MLLTFFILFSRIKSAWSIANSAVTDPAPVLLPQQYDLLSFQYLRSYSLMLYWTPPEYEVVGSYVCGKLLKIFLGLN